MTHFRIILVILAILIPMPAFGQTPEQSMKEAQALNQRVVELYQAGKYAEAIPLAEKSLRLTEKSLGPDHPDVATALNNLAGFYQAMGDYAKVEALYLRALSIREKALGTNHPAVAESLHSLGQLYGTMGNWAKTEPLLSQALAIREKTLGPEHPIVATSLSILTDYYRVMGDLAKAETMARRALKIREKVLGPQHPDVADSLAALANVLLDMGEYTKAEPLYYKALGISAKTLGANHSDTAYIFHSLGYLYREMGDYGKAESLTMVALAIEEKVLGPDHFLVAGALNELAQVYREMGNYARAEPLVRRALRIEEKARGPEHPQVAVILSNIALLEAAQQNYQSAFGSFMKALYIQDREIQSAFTITTEEQKTKFIQIITQGYGRSYENFLSLIHQYLLADQTATHDGLMVVLRRKGIVFDAQSRAREALQGRLSEADRKDWERLSSLRGELARLSLSKPEKMSPEEYQKTLTVLEQQIEVVEKRLADASALVAKELKQRTVTVEAAAKALPKGSALVEFVRIRDYDFVQQKVKPSSRYLAFVLTTDGEVTMVDLGDAETLERQARLVLEHIQTSIKSPQRGHQSLQALHQKVWVPLEKSLSKADKVLLSPDGQLNLVPFAALLDEQGRPLVERYRLAYVTSGRELVAAGTPILPDSDLLLVANPAFAQKGAAVSSPGSSRRSRNFRGSFDPLPGTELEAKSIPPLVAGKSEKKRIVVGNAATEGVVKAARSPRILHLATHGFFLEDEDLTPDDKQRGKKTAAPKYENPLVRSGLAFAGANHAAESTGDDDGILTALEITGMDLYGTDLVVLSACDTGVGEVQTGEGVFGLRRAFALAGAKNLMMSLWPVSDDVTASQMKAFYKNMQTMPPAEALRQAQLATIKELKTKFGGTAPPVLWAPFFLQGAQALGP